MNRWFPTILCLMLTWTCSSVYAQVSETDTLDLTTNKGAIFNRPFVLQGQLGKSSTAIGGYIEGNTNYFSTEGVSDGFSMELRRFNIFLYASVADFVKFISELEFEHGTEEIALETALLDFELDPAFVFRAGILLPPVGYFNQNHDGPKWEFIDRPLVSTTIIPATLSEVGFGFHGDIAMSKPLVPGLQLITYEIYLVNGLQDGIVNNAIGRTDLSQGKAEERFAEDNNGSPSLTGRLGLRFKQTGEVGASFYGGRYNTYQEDGLTVDEKRSLYLWALDYNLNIKKLQILGEWAWTHVNVPVSLGPDFGDKQWGWHTDVIYPIREGSLWKWQRTTVNASLRTEFVDYNVGTFEETGTNKYHQIWALVPGISLRFGTNTVLKANFRYQWERDLLGNPTTRTVGYQFGFASYF